MFPRTLYLARLIGLYCILMALSMFVRGQATVDIVTRLLGDAPLMFILGVITLAAGLAMVLAHNLWSGGALPVTVTLIGWLTLVKGLLFLFLSPETEAAIFLQGMHFQERFHVSATITLVLGIYLTYAGFRKSAAS